MPLDRENDYGLVNPTREYVDKCWDELVRSREKHAEFVKEWFDDVALEDVAEDAAENGKGDDDAEIHDEEQQEGSKRERMRMRMKP